MSEGEAPPKGEGSDRIDSPSVDAGEVAPNMPEGTGIPTPPGMRPSPPQHGPWVLPPYETQDYEEIVQDPAGPLQPLQPFTQRLTEAAEKMYDVTPLMPGEMTTPYFPVVPEEGTAPVIRPFRGPTPTTVCPHGLAGMCIICQNMPCDFIKSVVLRSLLTEVMYGRGGSPDER